MESSLCFPARADGNGGGALIDMYWNYDRDPDEPEPTRSENEDLKAWYVAARLPAQPQDQIVVTREGKHIAVGGVTGMPGPRGWDIALARMGYTRRLDWTPEEGGSHSSTVTPT